MQLILARHGNTFNPGEKVVWVGRKQDLPLAQTGKEQAARLAQTLQAMNLWPTVCYTGSLKRLQTFAEIVLQQTKPLSLKTSLIIDNRLNEIDYGAWGGLTTQEICDRFGQAAFERWEKQSLWPKPEEGGWGDTLPQMHHRIHTLASEWVHQHANQTILAVTSNGCIRYFLDLIPGALQQLIDTHTIKVSTGHFCWLTYDGTWRVNSWNQR